MVEIIGDASQIPNFTLNHIRNKVGLKDYEKGESYYLTKAVTELSCQGVTLRGATKGTAPEPYREWVSFDSRGIADAYCSCPVGGKGTCKHVAAVLLTFKMLQSNDKLSVESNLGKPKSPIKTVTLPYKASSPSPTKSSGGRFSSFGFDSPKKSDPVRVKLESEKNVNNNDNDMDTAPSSNISSANGTPEDLKSQNLVCCQVAQLTQKQLKAANKWLFLLVKQYHQNNSDLQQKLDDAEMKFDLECDKSQKLAKQIKSIKNEKMAKLNKELTFLSNIANAFKIKLDALTQIANINPASNPPSQSSTPNVIKPSTPLQPSNDNELKFSQPTDSFEEELGSVLAKTEMDYQLQKQTSKTEDVKSKPSENTFLESQEVPAFQEAVSSLQIDEMRSKPVDTPAEPDKKRKRTLFDVINTSGSPEPSMDITSLLTQGSSNDNPADKDLSNLIAKYISPTKEMKKQRTETEFEKLFLKKKNEE